MMKERLKNFGKRSRENYPIGSEQFIEQAAELLGDTRRFFQGYFHNLICDMQCSKKGIILILSDESGTQQFTMRASNLKELRKRFLRHARALELVAR